MSSSNMSTQTHEKNISDIIFILDESGSMSLMGNEPVQAVNSFIKAQKSLGDDGSTFSLWKFSNKVTQLIDDEDLQSIKEFKDFKPDGLTCLYDAIGHAITTKKEKEKYDNVICVILTDGFENCSTDFKATTIRDLIKEMEINHNWKFVYLGANQDAFFVGDSIGFDKSRCATFDCTPGCLTQLTYNTSAAIADYRVASAINRSAPLVFNHTDELDIPNVLWLPC